MRGFQKKIIFFKKNLAINPWNPHIDINKEFINHEGNFKMTKLDFTKTQDIQVQDRKVLVDGHLIYDGSKLGAKRLGHTLRGLQALPVQSSTNWTLTSYSFIYTRDLHVFVDGVNWFTFEDLTSAKSWVKMLRSIVARIQ